MTATTRSASRSPTSMSFASSEASLTWCSGTLRTSIGAGMRIPLVGSGGDHGAGVVVPDGVGDVLEGGDDGAAAAALDEPEGGLDLGSHAAAGELARRRLRPHLAGRHP